LEYPLSSNNLKVNQINKCAVKNCKNRGIVEVKIRFLKKSGKFCYPCRDELKKQDLIESEIVNYEIEKRLDSLQHKYE
jgi:hypothetical protein